VISGDQVGDRDPLEAVGSLALVTKEPGLYQQLVRGLSGRIEVFGGPEEVPWDRYYSSYIVDLDAGDFRGWNWPMVEVKSRVESTYVFVATDLSPLASMGVLPPRSVVFEKTETLVPRLRDFFRACGESGDLDRRFREVGYSETLRIFLFKFLSGRNFAVRQVDFDVADESTVHKISLTPDGYAAIVEQESGNSFEVPWDAVLYHADPGYPYYKSHSETDNRDRASAIGQRIKEERRRRQWTLAILEARTGIRAPNISRLEKGKHVPSLETLERFAGAFDMPVWGLIVAGRRQ